MYGRLSASSRFCEATTPRINRVIGEIKRNAGRPTAKTCCAVISGMMQLAVRYGALIVNPVHEVEAIESRPIKRRTATWYWLVHGMSAARAKGCMRDEALGDRCSFVACVFVVEESVLDRPDCVDRKFAPPVVPDHGRGQIGWRYHTCAERNGPR
ncbi:hypothetical protein GCM10010530_75240 [Kribbella aluminosa]